MRIYTEVVWSWDDEKGELVRESSKSYDYDGPLTLAETVQEVIESNNFTVSNAEQGRYPLDVSKDEYPHYVLFTALRSFTASEQSVRGQPNGSVALYMPPDALKTSYTQSIGDADLGGAISLVGGSTDVNIIQNAIEGGTTTGVPGASSGDPLAAAGRLGMDNAKAGIATRVQAGLGALSGGLVAGISKATGKVLNPHKAVVYQGPGGFRTFSYSFVMMPKSQLEAKEILKIVKFFKKRMHPGTGAGGINDVGSMTLTYPDEFHIQYFINNERVDGSSATKPLFKIHNCFMDSFSVDYTTSGVASFMDDNNPLTTTMSLSFKETQLLTKADIDAGY